MRFRALDACRGLCAVAVVLFHTDALTHWYWWPAIRNGYVAVDFFFVLSGFVIASAYQTRLATLADLGRYLLRRFGRLYPLHLVVLLVYLTIELVRLLWLRAPDALTGNMSLHALIEQLALVQGFTAEHESWNYPAWSISVELWTNIVFGLAVLVLGRRLIPVIVLISVALGTFIVTSGGEQLVFSDAMQDAIESIFEFGLGVLVYALYGRFVRQNWTPPATAELLVLPIVCVAFGYADALPTLAPYLAFACVVFVLAFEKGPLSRFLMQPLFVALGTISYSVYLTHSVYLAALDQAVIMLGQVLNLPIGGNELLTLGGPWAMDAATLFVLGVTILGSTLTYRCVEEPARRLFNWLSERLASKPWVPNISHNIGAAGS